MFILYGMYRFGKKRIAYRNDYCLTCDAVRVGEQYRTTDVGHLFFVPVLPLGSHARWQCATCGNDPRHRVRTSRPLLVVFAVVLVAISIIMWLGPLVPTSDAAMIWGMRIVFPLGFVALVVNLSRRMPEVAHSDQLARVTPLPTDRCIYCNGPLNASGYCGACAVQRLALPAPARAMAL